MENKQIKYEETQKAYWVFIVGIVSIATVIIVYKLQLEKIEILLNIVIIVSVIVISVALLFYKLKIFIDANIMTISFGVGLIKRSIELKDIDFNSIEEIKIPWYYGIGLRITPHGILFNTKFGKALKLKSKNNTKTILVGTDNFETIKKVLMKSEEI
ncbi:MAG: hypothetical protein COW71_03835 [Ignavibacteriales bacterium CG18_big_fil_WC_8_21_14_2_50_31_20]|nr:MAG: hypothetical protein COW71_03835 [Ignavibacteriales bacterium CG18_big_fil_WC_8_21_14_2_50_31_20]